MLTDLEARKIACSWHGGQGSALYALCSTGAIDGARDDHDVRDEISRCLMQRYRPSEYTKELNDLFDYVEHYIIQSGVRGPVEGWGDLSW
jgi:hypothetical protein